MYIHLRRTIAEAQYSTVQECPENGRGEAKKTEGEEMNKAGTGRMKSFFILEG